MNATTFNRLHSLRMENDAAGYQMQEQRPRFDRIAGRHENGTAPRAVAVPQLFQTPASVAARMVAALELEPGGRILEPSAGLGRLLDALRPCGASEVVAVEVAADCCRELFQQERERVTIKQRDFLALIPEETFDAVVMNPPFTMRSDIEHIKHAFKFLKPGCKMVALCMDGPQRERELKPMAETWERLPAASFKEAGTRIDVVMMTIRKRLLAQAQEVAA